MHGRGACVVGGMHVWGCAYLGACVHGGGCACPGCVCAGGCVPGGHACPEGACMLGGMHAIHAPQHDEIWLVNARPVRILLECILVLRCFDAMRML